MLKKINKIKEKTVLWIRIILIMTPEENSNFTSSIENMIIYMNNKPINIYMNNKLINNKNIGSAYYSYILTKEVKLIFLYFW